MCWCFSTDFRTWKWKYPQKVCTLFCIVVDATPTKELHSKHHIQIRYFFDKYTYYDCQICCVVSCLHNCVYHYPFIILTLVYYFNPLVIDDEDSKKVTANSLTTICVHLRRTGLLVSR